MITIQININGNCLVARSCARIEDENKKGEAVYKTDCGKKIYHNPDDGAIALSHKLLDCIKEVKDANV